MNFAYRAGEINEYIINIRRHIHAHPELSFNERKTTAYIADKLEEMGVDCLLYTSPSPRDRG